MKIAIVLNTSWNIYNFRMGLIRALIDDGHQVYAVAPEDDFSRLLEQEGCIYQKVTMDSRGASPLRDLGLIAELRKIYSRIRPDVVLHYTIKPNIYGTIAAATLGIPAINNVSGLGTVFLKDNLVNRTAITLYRAVFRLPRLVFFQNADDRDLFLKKKLVREQITALLPGSGIDIGRFAYAPYQQKRPFTFLMVSRLIYDKGVSEYVEAARILKADGVDARFQLLGAKDPVHKRGIPLDVVDEWIESGTIEYLGTTSDVRQPVIDSDCIVLPSYREGTPRTLLEAASMGRAIVATNVPGCNNVVEDGVNGLLCEAKNVTALADAMRVMAQADEELVRDMGCNGRKIVEQRFDEKIVINKYINAIESCTTGAGRLTATEQ
ncbi:MAG: glycosyltransferase family 4 protein [Cyclobacteriaceae bacterium]